MIAHMVKITDFGTILKPMKLPAVSKIDLTSIIGTTTPIDPIWLVKDKGASWIRNLLIMSFLLWVE